MKANEAPEKIYLVPDKIYLVEDRQKHIPMEYWYNSTTDDSKIEYTRTDAFIEKAEKYLKDRLLNYIEYYRRGVSVSTEEFIEEFLKTMRQ